MFPSLIAKHEMLVQIDGLKLIILIQEGRNNNKVS